MPKLSQEMIAIIGVGVALAALDVTTTSALRAEIQAVRVEARADREAWRAESQALRAEARADREAMRADREAWRAESQALRVEARADREAWQTRMRADREAWQAEMRADREAVRADREAWRAEMRARREEFEAHVVRLEQHHLRLTEQQGALGGLVEGLGRRTSATGADDRPG